MPQGGGAIRSAVLIGFLAARCAVFPAQFKGAVAGGHRPGGGAIRGKGRGLPAAVIGPLFLAAQLAVGVPFPAPPGAAGMGKVAFHPAAAFRVPLGAGSLAPLRQRKFTSKWSIG